MKFGNWLIKYWGIISAIIIVVFLGLVWGLRLEAKVNDHEEQIRELNKIEDRLEHLIIKLNTLEDAREKGICR